MSFLGKFLKDKDNKNLSANIILAFAVKGLSLLVTFFSTPLYIRFFNNNEILGLWYTVLSILSWINVCDLGLGNGLRNNLTGNLVKGEMDLAKKNISSTYYMLVIIIIPIFAVGAIAFNFIDFNAFFEVGSKSINPKTLKLSIIVLFGGVAISFILRTINSIIYAIQKAAINNFISLISSAIPLFFVLFYKGTNSSSNFLVMSIVHVVAINLPLVVVTVILFSSKILKNVRPSIRCFSWQIAKKIVGFGMRFFLAQGCFMLLMSTNEIMISKIFSTESVVTYSIYYRLFTLVGSLFMLALTPLWSNITKAFAQSNFSRIQKTNHFLYLLSALAIACEFIMVAILPFILKIWLGEETIPVDYVIAFSFALYGGTYILNVVLTTVANGIGCLGSQIIFYGNGAALKIPATLLFKTLFNNWVVILLYDCLVLIVFSIYQVIWVERKIKAAIKNQQKPLQENIANDTIV